MNKTNKQKVSDLLACYRDLASGEPLEHLFEKYVRAEVLVSLELFNKGITIKQLEEFIQKRDQHFRAMLGQKDEIWAAIR